MIENSPLISLVLKFIPCENFLEAQEMIKDRETIWSLVFFLSSELKNPKVLIK